MTWLRGDGSYTKASRKPSAIRYIVIHATDGGSFDGNVWWLSGGHSHVSSHFVVARDGNIAQLVHMSDIAWHAGNWKINQHSVGIEHVGDTYDAAGWPIEQYRASAKLVAWIATKCGIPIDRQHIIGHYQVPDPNDPTQGGGSDHHTDPGPYWNWGLYMRLVRRYANPPSIDLRSSTVYRGQTLAGVVPWRVATVAHDTRTQRVDFVVDGEVLWSDHEAPFSFGGGRGWNTTQLPNGRHTLVVRAIGGDGASATKRYVVRVRNYAFSLTTAGIRPWQRVRGIVRLRANVWGARADRVQLSVDGHAISRDLKRPYTLRWNSHKVADGRHEIRFAAWAVDGRSATRKVVVVVENRRHAAPPRARPTSKPQPRPAPAPKPPPAPAPAPAVTSQSLANGQAVSGTIAWQAQTTGAVARVEFLVDGAVRATATAAPWTYAWDTAAEAPGPHAVAVRAVASDGRTAEASTTVVVAAPASP
jgi:hypothetical protein